VFKALKVSVAILNLIRVSMGSQWSLFRVDELESEKPVPVTTRARVFCVRWRREMCLAGMPYRMELALSRAVTKVQKVEITISLRRPLSEMVCSVCFKYLTYNNSNNSKKLLGTMDYSLKSVHYTDEDRPVWDVSVCPAFQLFYIKLFLCIS